jgi:hypothetical protein
LADLRNWFVGLLLMACYGIGHGNPLILFKPGSDQGSGKAAVLALPLGAQVTITSITSRCKAARGNAVRIYDLDSGECGILPAIGPGVFHQPSLDQTLQGNTLVGESVQFALEAGLFVWYDLYTSRACVAGFCNTTFATSEGPPDPTSVRINSFTANPNSMIAGNQTELSWTTSNATSCTLGDNQGGGPVSVSLNGSASRIPLVTTTFTFICQGSNGPAISNVVVTVDEPLPEDIFSDGFESLIPIQ